MAKAKSGKFSGKVRYAVVGLGHIAQVAALPAFTQTKKSALTALVSGSPEKLKKLGKKYAVKSLWSYDDYEACLQSDEIDAVFIALPNDMHREYAVRAARAGIHVLSEKPLGVTRRDCEEMIRTAEKHKVKLMTAYRLHFEEANLRTIEMVESGKIGEPRFIAGTFSFQVTDPDNIRLKKARGGGTLYDIGVYCINAARYIFRSDPVEVVAVTANTGDRRFREIDEMTAAILRFPGERLASFTTSFGAADSGYYQVVGTKGSVQLDPAYEYTEELTQTLKVAEKEQEKTFGKRDQFGAEIDYFSECVLSGKSPEPSGLEGLIDVAIVEALYQSARTGKVVKIPKFPKKPWPDLRQARKLPPIKRPEVIKVDSPHD